MALVTVNFLAVAVAAVVNVVLGFAWYGVFSKQWMKLTGMTEKSMKEGKGKMPVNVVLSLAAAAALSYGMSWIVDLSGAATAGEGAVTGLIAGVLIAAMTAAPNYIWPGKTLKLFVLDEAYTVIGMAAIGAIVAVL